MRGAKSIKMAESRVDSARSTNETNSSIVDEFLGFCEASDADKTNGLSRKRAEAIPKKSPQDEFVTWLNALKVAIVNKNEAQAMNLVENLPDFGNINDLQSARELILQVGAWLEAEKKALATKMEKLKSQKRFLS